MLNLIHLSIICQSPEHHHDKGCSLASNQKADEIGEARFGLVLSQVNIADLLANFIKSDVISLLILDSAVENGLLAIKYYLLISLKKALILPILSVLLLQFSH